MPKCTLCNNELRQVPAGVSKKTGKPYNAFWACDNGCKQPKFQNNYKNAPTPQSIGQNAPEGQISPKTATPDWDAIRDEKQNSIKEHMAIKLAVEAWIAGIIDRESIKVTAQWIYGIDLLREKDGDIKGDADLMF